MRLSTSEIEAIRSAVFELDSGAEIYLFGSRVDDELRGGDIDLLVISEKIGFSDRIDLLVALKDALGAQKIDLLVRSTAMARADPFVQSVLKDAVPL